MTTSGKLCRNGECCQPVTLREAWHCQINHSEMRVEELARRIGMQPGTLYEAVNPTGMQSLPAARHHELLLELTADNLAVVTYLSRKQNAVTVRVDAASSVQRMVDVFREVSDFVAAHAEAEADGKKTPEEAQRIAHEAFEAIGSIVAIVKDAEREAAEPKPRIVARERRA